MDEATIEAANSIIGTKLYDLVKMSTARSEKDRKILDQMTKHAFINLELLELPQYIEE